MSDEPPRLHPKDFEALADAMREGPVRLPPPPSDVPTGRDARLFEAMLKERVALFLTAEQIEARIDKAIAERLGLIGLRVDEDHVEDTASGVRTLLKWQKRFEVAGNTIIGGLILSAFYAIVKFLGFKGISFPGGN